MTRMNITNITLNNNNDKPGTKEDTSYDYIVYIVLKLAK